MPTLADLRRRYQGATDDIAADEPARRPRRAAQPPPPLETAVQFDDTETLVSDARSRLTPGQVVDGKFGVALRLEEARRGSLRPHVRKG